MDSVISVFESKMNKVHTTHSWDFLGVNSLYQYNQQGTEASSDVIIGVIDSGNALKLLLFPLVFCHCENRGSVDILCRSLA